MKKLLTATIGALCTLCTVVPLAAGVGGGPFTSGLLRDRGGDETITGMARFSNGDVVVCGWVPSYRDPWDGAQGFSDIAKGSEEAFIAILDADLTTVKAFTFYGGLTNDRATDVVIRDDEDVIVVGTTWSEDLPMTTGSLSSIYSAGQEGFVAGFSRDLSELRFATYIGGSGDEHPMRVAVDGGGSIYLCGTTTSVSGFPTTNGYDRQYEGGTDGFVMRLAPNAASVQFSTYYGSEGYDEIVDLALDNSGAVYMAGTTYSASFPTFPRVPQQWWLQKERPYDWSYNGGFCDAFLLILSEDGAQCIVASYYGGDGDDFGTGVVVVDGNVTLVGHTSSSDLVSTGGQQAFLNGEMDAFLVTFDARGRTLKGASYFGGSGRETVRGAVNGPGSAVCLWGETTSGDLVSAGSGSRTVLYGAEDAFFAVLGIGGSSIVSTFGGSQADTIARCVIEPDGNILLGGRTTSPMIPLDTGMVSHSDGSGILDAMVVRYSPGLIDLISPTPSAVYCEGQDVRVSWNRLEMRQSDTYVVEARRAGGAWTTVAGPTSSASTVWTIADPTFVGQRVDVRVRSSRYHVSETILPISVDPRPSIVVQPPSTKSVCEGETLTLNVDAMGSDLSYQWRRSGQSLAGQTGPTLEISAVRTSDAGQYDVLVIAGCGLQTTSALCSVSIGQAPSVTVQPQSTTLTEGQTLVLTCAATGTDLSFQWHRNTTAMPGATAATLSITGITLEESGAYWCAVRGTCGADTTSRAEVAVEPVVTVGGASIDNPCITITPSSQDGSVTIERCNTSTDVGWSISDLRGNTLEQGSLPRGTAEIHIPLRLPSGVYMVVAGDTSSLLSILH